MFVLVTCVIFDTDVAQLMGISELAHLVLNVE